MLIEELYDALIEAGASQEKPSCAGRRDIRGEGIRVEDGYDRYSWDAAAAQLDAWDNNRDAQ
jgi:hypothetical protein